MAGLAAVGNGGTGNIGGLGWHTVVEGLLDELSFSGPGLSGKEVTIDAQYVRDKLDAIVKDEDLARYIL